MQTCVVFGEYKFRHTPYLFLPCCPHKIKGEIHIPPFINQNYNLRVSYTTTGQLTRLSLYK